jgi:hypothetical protein
LRSNNHIALHLRVDAKRNQNLLDRMKTQRAKTM